MNNIILNLYDLGKAIRAERKALGYTQQELADRAMLKRQTIINIEKGEETSTSTLLKVVGSMKKRIDITSVRPDIDQMKRLIDESK